MIFSCRRHLPIADQGSEVPEVTISDKGEFSPLAAKEFFESNVKSYSLLNLAKESDDINEDVKSFIDSRILTVHWERVASYENGDNYIVDVTVSAVDKVFARKMMSDEYGNRFREKTLAHTKLMFIKNKRSGVISVWVATLVPTKEFVRDKTKRMGAVRGIPTNEEFTGLVLYSKLDGKFERGHAYKKGKLSGVVVRADNIPDFSNMKQVMDDDHDCQGECYHGIAPICYPLEIIISEDVVLSKSNTIGYCEKDGMFFCSSCMDWHDIPDADGVVDCPYVVVIEYECPNCGGTHTGCKCSQCYHCGYVNCQCVICGRCGVRNGDHAGDCGNDGFPWDDDDDSTDPGGSSGGGGGGGGGGNPSDPEPPTGEPNPGEKENNKPDPDPGKKISMDDLKDITTLEELKEFYPMLAKMFNVAPPATLDQWKRVVMAIHQLRSDPYGNFMMEFMANLNGELNYKVDPYLASPGKYGSTDRVIILGGSESLIGGDFQYMPLSTFIHEAAHAMQHAIRMTNPEAYALNNEYEATMISNLILMSMGYDPLPVIEDQALMREYRKSMQGIIDDYSRANGYIDNLNDRSYQEGYRDKRYGKDAMVPYDQGMDSDVLRNIVNGIR